MSLPIDALKQLFALFSAQQYAALRQQADALMRTHGPDAFAHKLLGAAASSMQDLPAAIAGFRASVDLSPSDAETWRNLSNAYYEHHDYAAAAQAIAQAIALEPNHPENHYRSAACAHRLNQHDDALRHVTQLLSLAPTHTEGWMLKGRILQAQGARDEALAAFEHLLSQEPNHAGAMLQCAVLLEKSDAQRGWTLALKAHELQPSAYTHTHLGYLYRMILRYDESKRHLEAAAALDPNHADAHNLLGLLCKDMGDVDLGITHLRRALELRPLWFSALSTLLLIRNYQMPSDLAGTWADIHMFGQACDALGTPRSSWDACADAAHKTTLRVGIVSGDLRQHPVAHFFQNLCRHLRPEHGIELHVFYTYASEDQHTQAIRAQCHTWCAIAESSSDAALAELIHTQRIDVLMDLAGHTGYNRLKTFALKPAPVQVAWLGYFASTGVPAMDYVLADPHSLPEALEGQFTEAIWRLPHTRLSFIPPHDAPEVNELPMLHQAHIQLASMGNLAKFNPTTAARWARVLTGLPNAKLLIKGKQLDTPSMRDWVKQCLMDCGVRAEQIELEGHSAYDSYLRTYHRIDLILDTAPFPGGTTTTEALYMGVPVLTLAGDTFVSHQGAGLLHNAGLSDWVATDEEDWVARAKRHCVDPQALNQLRQNLRGQLMRSPLMDGAQFATDWSQAVWGMWRARMQAIGCW